MIFNKDYHTLQHGIRMVAWNQMHGKDLHRLRKISRFEHFQWVAIWLLLKEMWGSRYHLTIEKKCHHEWKQDGSPTTICCTKCGMKKYDRGFGWEETPWQMNYFVKYAVGIWPLDVTVIHWKKNYVNYAIKNLVILIRYKNTCRVIINNNQNKILKETVKSNQMRHMHFPRYR